MGAVGSEPVQPGREQRVQRRLADADRRVRPDEVDREVIGHRVRVDGRDVGEPGRGGVPATEVEGPAVDIDGPHRCGGGTRGERAGDRAVPAPEVDERAAGARRRALEEEVLGARVDALAREHAAVGGEGERDVGQVETHRRGDRSGARLRLEVLTGSLTHGGNLPVPCRA